MGDTPTERLAVDVVTVDGQVLARAGDVLGEPLFEAARRAGGRAAHRRRRLGDSDLLRDLEAVSREPLYRVVFHRPEPLCHSLSLLAELHVPCLVLDELGQMKGWDHYTYRHVLMTTVLAARMLGDLQLPPGEATQGAYAALTHDFGKLRVPREILHKETPLTRSELRLLRQHPEIGALLLHYYLPEDDLNVAVALSHHERPDGSGYPLRVRLSDRMVGVIAVSDMFDALISPRPYRRRPYDIRGALEFLWAEAKAGRVDEGACRLLISYNRHDQPDPWTMRVSDDVRSGPPAENQYGKLARQ